MREEDLRDMFDALHAGQDPELRLSAADVVRAGERVRRRRRAVAVTGSGLATVAAIVVAVVLLPGGRGDVPAPVGPAGQNTGHSATPATSPAVTRSPIGTSPTSTPGGVGAVVRTTPAP